jgi:Mg2+-importing ATPase
MKKFDSWDFGIDQLFAQFESKTEGLSSQEADNRLKIYGPNTLKTSSKFKKLSLFLSQFTNPLILLLMGAATLSFFLGGKTDASIILTIVVASGLLGFFQERGALNALEKLFQLVENKASILREGTEMQLSFSQIVPGDVILLRAGDLIPADCILIEANHLFVDEAMMTGESSPVEKMPGASVDTTPTKKLNCLFLGTMVASGFGKALVVSTGRNTEFAAIAEHIRFRPPETAFEIGVRRFGQFLLQVTLFLVIIIFAANIYLKKDIIESFLFSLALAIGLTPQLLPAIISVNLSHGARRMAKKKVVVKRLTSLENFGQMDVLCSDKTGTITLGKLRSDGTFGIGGMPSKKGNFYGYLNAHFQAGYVNPLDQAILDGIANTENLDEWKKIDEIPYDFTRKRLSVVFEHQTETILIAKGAFLAILAVCTQVELPDGSLAPLENYQSLLQTHFEEKSKEGFRLLGLAYGKGSEEQNLVFLGMIQFFDPMKPDIANTVSHLQKQGVSLKIITGDHPAVAAHAASCLNLPHVDILTGAELEKISDQALLKVASKTTIFAQIDPNEKERIILALRKAGHVVGYLGDGINDVSALHSADVGIAVNSGADAAKEAADLVLLEKDLSVLSIGIEEGRRTFANTLKYVYMATSANFGNMFSMAGISLFLNFLPLLPKQVLLTNFFSDLPEMALATDHVDPEILTRPVKWHLPFIRRFMIIFGLVSSLADYLTFGVLLSWLHADEVLFRSGWFVESVISATLVVLLIRTKKPFYRSKPGKLLIAAVLFIVCFTPLLLSSPLGQLFGFQAIPLSFYAPLILILVFYLFLVEIIKHFFFKHTRYV